MPLALLLAFAASLGLHAVVLFGTQVESYEPEPTPILAEMRPLERPPPEPEKPPPKPRPRTKPAAKAVPLTTEQAADTAVPPLLPGPDVAEDVVQSAAKASADAQTETPPPASLADAHKIPEHGRVNFRVERGDQGFEIGTARHVWRIADGRYRIESQLETTGLVWLFKAVRIEMVSRGEMTAEGLRPDDFVVRRNGAVRERAAFDWQQMTVRIGDRAPQALDRGAQDLLSFNYQLGYLPEVRQGMVLPLATGKKYGQYRLEVLGDEVLELPAGTMRTLHLRAPGANTTELWLAYDYLMLPVKIRHLDPQGESLVQVATEILMSPE